MNTRSCKAKGKRLQKNVQIFLLEKYKPLGLVEGDIENAIMGEHGRDIKLSPAAERLIPYDIECKNTENFNRNSAIQQAEHNTKKGRIPVVVFKRNHSKTYAIIKESNFNNTEKFQFFTVRTKVFNTWDVLDKCSFIKFYRNDEPYLILEFKLLFI